MIAGLFVKGNSDMAAIAAAMQERNFRPVDDSEADALALLLRTIDGQGGQA